MHAKHAPTPQIMWRSIEIHPFAPVPVARIATALSMGSGPHANISNREPAFLSLISSSSRGSVTSPFTPALPSFVESGLTRIILGHLSEENNLPSIAVSEAVRSLTKAGRTVDSDYTIDVAPVVTNGKSMTF